MAISTVYWVMSATKDQTKQLACKRSHKLVTHPIARNFNTTKNGNQMQKKISAWKLPKDLVCCLSMWNDANVQLRRHSIIKC